MRVASRALFCVALRCASRIARSAAGCALRVARCVARCVLRVCVLRVVRFASVAIAVSAVNAVDA
eukprot:7953606-Lingulodinium_polyedra.AAC.1